VSTGEDTSGTQSGLVCQVRGRYQCHQPLPEGERLEFVEALLARQAAQKELPFDQAWLGELQRRSAEIDAGTVQPEPWSVVRDRVRRRLERRSGG
jgi:putative addiction module component (TIGR02574 family)